MIKRDFDELLTSMLLIDPELKEENIKPVLKKIASNQIDYNLNLWIKYLIKAFKTNKNIVEEINYLNNSLNELESSLVCHRVEDTYKRLKKGYINEKDQVYSRRINLVKGQGISIYWSLKKARDIIQKQKVIRSHFPIDKMNITQNELEQEYLSKAIKNKKPAILLTYEPYLETKYESFLLDGNHRAYANFLFKKQKMYPVITLNSEQTVEAMEHRFFQYFYLMHVLSTILVHAQRQRGLVADIIDNPESRYNKLKLYTESLDSIHA